MSARRFPYGMRPLPRLDREVTASFDFDAVREEIARLGYQLRLVRLEVKDLRMTIDRTLIIER